MGETTVDTDKLTKPFGPDEIEWRIRKGGTKKDGSPYAKIVPYPDARAVMDRLDDACGPGNWRDDYRPGPDGGVLCGISVRIDGEWITKWDGAGNTDVEAVKGGLTDAFKRAAVKWNVGDVRELYRMGDHWAEFDQNGRYRDKIEDKWYAWNPPRIDLETGEILESGTSGSPEPETGTSGGGDPKAPTKKQTGLIERLLEEREVPEDQEPGIRKALKASAMDKARASDCIAWLLELPEEGDEPEPEPEPEPDPEPATSEAQLPF